MNRQIDELTSLVKTLAEKITSNNREGDDLNVLSTAMSSRSNRTSSLIFVSVRRFVQIIVHVFVNKRFKKASKIENQSINHSEGPLSLLGYCFTSETKHLGGGKKIWHEFMLTM